MSGSGRHIIQKLELELKTDLPGFSTQTLQSKAGEVLREQLPDVLESLFGEFDTGHHVIERLELSLGTLNADRFEEHLLETLKQQLHRKLQSAETRNNSGDSDKKKKSKMGDWSDGITWSEDRYRDEILFHFLKSGVLPWYAGRERGAGLFTDEKGSALGLNDHLKKMMTRDPGRLKTFIHTHRHIKNVMKRIPVLFEPVIEDVSKLFLSGTGRKATAFYSTIRGLPGFSSNLDIKAAFLQALEVTGAGKPFRQFVLTFFLQLEQNDSSVSDKLHTVINEKWLSDIKVDTGRHFQMDKEELTAILALVKNARKQKEGKREGKGDSQADTGEAGRELSALLQLYIKQSGMDTSGSEKWLSEIMRLTRSYPREARLFFLSRKHDKKKDEWLRQPGKSGLKEIFELMKGIRPPGDEQTEEGQDIKEFEKESKNTGTTGDINIGNAGLVLLWPFLQKFFTNLELIYQHSFLDEEARQKAMQLLGYLESGEDQLPEYRMALIKLLCGYPMDAPPFEPVSLSSSEKKEAVVLIESAVSHWKVLKNTTVDGFRSSFIRREGLLRSEESAWKLYVERKTYDILLDKLPWTYSVVKLPWMNRPLMVDW